MEKGYMKIVGIIVIVAALLISLYTIYTPTVGATPLDDSEATEEGVQELVEGNNRFALEMYDEIKQEDENTFFSPWSISAALSMTYEGARGETAEEMRAALNLPEDNTIRRSSFARLHNLFNLEKEYELETANALWLKEGYEFLEEYLEINRNYYDAKTEELDFSQSEQSADTINEWVEDITRGKIEELITEDQVNPEMALILTNAIYFQSDWTTEFDEGETRKEEFKVNPDKSVEVDMMTMEETPEFDYAETEDLKAIKMPYKGEEVSMFIILPKEEFTLPKIEENLTTEKLNEIQDNMTVQEVDVHFPKLEIETEYDLKEKFMDMGMEKPFEPGVADFSGMDGSQLLFIDFIVHKAYIEVMEEGTEAAAATGVGVGITAAPEEKVFYANHPFLFTIQDERTGSILFMGRVINPLPSPQIS